MKKLIISLIVLAFAAPFSSFAINKLERTGKIEKDETGGYSESQKDYHHKRAKQVEEKSKGGYYNGEYHNTSPEFKQGEWQFVDSSSKASSKKQAKKHKKVTTKETTKDTKKETTKETTK